jgi:asparagine synthase (glutamine-hydrolysing)
MSAQAGVLFFDRRPVHAALPGRLRASMGRSGPDRSNEYVEAGVVMVHAALDVTPEDPLERQPYASKRGHVMTWDGRLDNRDDLLLQLSREMQDDTTDVALAMAAYERWEEAGLARLVGDWSLALWDPSAHEIVLASDWSGNRPLYFVVENDRALWSTLLQPLVLSTDRADHLDRHFIANFLTFGNPQHRTPYTGIAPVPPAGVVRIDRTGRVTSRRFWDLTCNRITYRDPRDYEIHLRSVFEDAVRVRLRSTRPVWLELSGGLDSSSIVCMAGVLARRRMLSVPPLHTVSYFSETSSESDDRRFIAAVEDQVGFTRGHFRFEDYDALAEPHWVAPSPRSGIACAELDAALKAGVRVILSGRLGDTVMGNFIDAATDLASVLADGSLRMFLHLAHRWSLTSRRPLIHVLGSVALAYLPAAVFARHSYRVSRQRQAGPRMGSALDLVELFSISPDLVDAVEEDFASYRTHATTLAVGAKRRTLTSLCSYSLRRSLSSPTESHAVFYSYPYSHRPLVEYMLALPSHVILEPGITRALMRRAFEGFVPARIMTRQGKGYAAPMVTRAFLPVATDLLQRVDRLRIVERGYVQRDRLRARLTDYVGGDARLSNLPLCGAVERWLEARDRSNPITERRCESWSM